MLYHQGTQCLESENIFLRPFVMADAEAMFKNWAGDHKTTSFLVWDTYNSVAEAEKKIRQWVAAYDEPTVYHWAVVLKEGDEPIGSISVVHIQEVFESAEIGFCIGSSWWGQGHTTEALILVLNYLFGVVGFHRLEARHEINNVASEKVQLKAGMMREGVLREAYKNKNGAFSDMVINALTKADWEVL